MVGSFWSNVKETGKDIAVLAFCAGVLYSIWKYPDAWLSALLIICGILIAAGAIISIVVRRWERMSH